MPAIFDAAIAWKLENLRELRRSAGPAFLGFRNTQFCAAHHIPGGGTGISWQHQIRPCEAAMTTITKQTRRVANWLSRSAAVTELNALSDRALQDVGLVRYQPAIEACKPFWMA